MATKSYLCLTPAYFEILRSEASSAAAPLTADVLGRWELARVSGIVTSQVMDLPRCHGISVQPSTRLSHHGSRPSVLSVKGSAPSGEHGKQCR